MTTNFTWAEPPDLEEILTKKQQRFVVPPLGKRLPWYLRWLNKIAKWLNNYIERKTK